MVGAEVRVEVVLAGAAQVAAADAVAAARMATVREAAAFQGAEAAVAKVNGALVVRTATVAILEVARGREEVLLVRARG
jgi:hypothetical protein